jgi:predicted GNAT superfamily acetyltransferase
MQVTSLWRRFPFIELVRVEERLRGRGLGRRMLALAEETLAVCGHRSLYSSSLADEPGPQAWHRAMGFGECGRLLGVNDGGIDELFFCKAIRAPEYPAASGASA